MSATVALSALAVAKVQGAPEPVQPRPLVESEARSIAYQVAAQEPMWILIGQRQFPGDFWSQGDDFFNAEQRTVRGLAAGHQVRVGDVFRAVDAHLRSYPQGRKVTVSPCKPRPFYD